MRAPDYAVFYLRKFGEAAHTYVQGEIAASKRFGYRRHLHKLVAFELERIRSA